MFKVHEKRHFAKKEKLKRTKTAAAIYNTHTGKWLFITF